MKKSVRVWNLLDIEEVNKHLVIVDEIDATCNNCKQLGLRFPDNQRCPSCDTEFKYCCTSSGSIQLATRILQKIKAANSACLLLDKEDYNKAKAKADINDLFKS